MGAGTLQKHFLEGVGEGDPGSLDDEQQVVGVGVVPEQLFESC